MFDLKQKMKMLAPLSNLNIRDKRKMTAIDYGCLEEKIKILAPLSNLNIPDKRGTTALDYAQK